MKGHQDVYPWTGSGESKFIEAAIEKHEKLWWGSKYKPAMTKWRLSSLSNRIWEWESEFHEYPPLRHKEQSETIERINRNAKALLRDIHALGLPTQSVNYFTNEELIERYADLADMFDADIKGLLWSDDVTLKECVETYTKWDFPESDVRLDTLLAKLADKAMLHELAIKPLLTKTNTDQAEVTFVIRKLAISFHERYGKTLPTTIEHICAAIYPDAEIDNDKVRNKLRNFNLIQ